MFDEMTPAMLGYLGEIYRLVYDTNSGGAVTTSAIAERLDVSPPAAVKMMQKLAQSGHLKRKPYKGAQLTPKGEKMALRTIRRHRLTEAFLVTVMKFGWHEAHDYAHHLEMAVDDLFEDRMDELAGFPTRCPHGEPIPSKDGVMPKIEDMPLLEFPTGIDGLISRVRSRSEAKLKYLAEHEIVPGTAFNLLGRGPFNGPVRVKIGVHQLVLGSELAGEIFVEAQK